jgi:predicted Holliday junction resolvase-like endonuclease
MKLYLILIAVFILLIMVCVFCFKKIQKLDKEIDELENELKRKIKIEEQKEKINTGDVESDFNTSIELLQNYSDKRNKKLSESNSKR